MKFFTAPNLAATELTEGEPWEFHPDESDLSAFRRMPKVLRRQKLLLPTTGWNVYTPVRAIDARGIVSKDNPPVSVRGFVADYDAVQGLDAVVGLVNQIPEPLQPTYLETTLGGKCRLVWLFPVDLPVVDSPYLERLWRELAKRGKWETALAGFDPASFKPSERWTNGGVWYELTGRPIAEDVLIGSAVEAGKALSAARQEIPLQTIADEVTKRWPGRWQGDFVLDSVGVRFWDPEADAPAGCQVKPDGMLCFTGRQPFVKWRELLGPSWVDEHSAIHMGEAVAGIYFDGKHYWEQAAGRWHPYQRQDILLHIAGRGMSATKAKGQVISDAEAALLHVQRNQRVDGAAPLINYPAGLVELWGRRFLNTVRPTTVRRSGDQQATAAKFPWVWDFLSGRFADPLALHTLLAWLKRGHISITEHAALMGQIAFICGPRDSGKTLATLRIFTPVLGGYHRNPYDYFVGTSSFTDDLFEAPVWAINDEDAPANEAQRQKFIARLKAAAVNPEHTYHPKFCARITVPWQGRMIVTLNDDPTSVGILPEVNSNTADKILFFRASPYDKRFPPNAVLERIIADELPHFVEFLHQWEEPEEVLENSRMGVRSYFDPVVLSMARHQHAAHNLQELLAKWISTAVYWTEGADTWEGTATDLLSDIASCDPLARLADEWKVSTIAKRLVDLAKIPGSGVEHIDGSNRIFRITRSASTP